MQGPLEDMIWFFDRESELSDYDFRQLNNSEARMMTKYLGMNDVQSRLTEGNK